MDTNKYIENMVYNRHTAQVGYCWTGNSNVPQIQTKKFKSDNN